MPLDIAIALALHLFSAVIWVGGMFFAYMALRPAAGALEPPVRLTLWTETFKRFFPWVWAAVVLLLATGHYLIETIYGGMAVAGIHIHLMMTIGYLMVVNYAFLYFKPFARLKAAVAAQDWPTGGANLNRIRQIVLINLILGLINVVLGGVGGYLA